MGIPGDPTFGPGRLQVGPGGTRPLRQDRGFDVGFQDANRKVEVLFRLRELALEGVELRLDLGRHDPVNRGLFFGSKIGTLGTGLGELIQFLTNSTVSESPLVYVQWSQAVMLFPVIEACKLVALQTPFPFMQHT